MECFFTEGFYGSGWLRASERFWVDLGGRRADFLHPTASVILAGLGLMVGIWSD